MGKQPSKWTPPSEDEVIEQKPVMKAWTPPAEDEVVEPLKKKDLTVSETNSSAGTTQAGSVVSQEPGPKAKQPSGKSTEGNWFTDLGETLAAFPTALVKGGIAAATDMLPGMVAAGRAGSIDADFDNLLARNKAQIEGIATFSIGENFTEDQKKRAIDEYVKRVGQEQYQVEKDAYTLRQLRKKSDLLKYSDEQDIERQETLGDTPQTTGQIKDIKTALAWLGGAGGNALGTAPAMIAGPVFPFLMEKGEAYKEGLKKIQETTGLNRDEILALDLDKAARENSDISGAINTGLELAGNLAVFGRFIPKGIATKFIAKAFTSKFGAPVVAAMGEGITEGIQAMDTELAAMMATGKYKDVFEAANAITPEKWAEIRQEAYTGAAGGTVISAGGGLIEAQSRATRLADIKNQRAAKAPVIQEVKSTIKSSDDELGLQMAADEIVNNVNEGTPTTSTTPEPIQPAPAETQQVVTPAVQEGTTPVGQGETETAATVLEWQPGDVVKTEGRPDRVIKEVIGKISDRMTKVVFEDGSMGAIDLKEKQVPTEQVQEKQIELSAQQAINKYDNDEKFNIDELVDELESSDNPKIQEAVAKYRADVKEGLEVWGGREDSEARETGFVNEVRKALDSPSTPVADESNSNLTVGTNYQKVNNEWQVKQADGTWAPVISNNPNKTKETQNAELKELKDIMAQLEAQEPQNLKMSNTEKFRIKQLEPQTVWGAARKLFWNGTKVLWETKDKKSSIPKKGISEEGGLKGSDRDIINEYIDDKNGLSIDAAAEKLVNDNTDLEGNSKFTFDEAKDAIIQVLAQSNPKNWYAEQLETEDTEYLQGAEQRFDARNRLAQQIADLEAQEAAAQETNKQLYENERRINRGEPQEGSGTPAGQVQGEQREEGEGRESQTDASQSIRENGDENKSKQALEELNSLMLTHVPGLGMGQNQAKGMYLSTEEENRYATEENKPIKVRANIKNPFVSTGNIFYDIQRKIIQARFGKNSIDELTDTEGDLLAEMVNEHFINEGYDSIYFPQSEEQEGELIVFDRANVIFPDPFADAVHAAMQTKLELDMVPGKVLLETDRPVELRSRQRDIRKRLDILNKLINCR